MLPPIPPITLPNISISRLPARRARLQSSLSVIAAHPHISTHTHARAPDYGVCLPVEDGAEEHRRALEVQRPREGTLEEDAVQGLQERRSSACHSDQNAGDGYAGWGIKGGRVCSCVRVGVCVYESVCVCVCLFVCECMHTCSWYYY